MRISLHYSATGYSTEPVIMHFAEQGDELLALCKSEEDKYAEIEALLGSLPPDRRREVVRYHHGEVRSVLRGSIDDVMPSMKY